MPEVASLAVLEAKVGLRPGRPRVRLKRDGRVIHNYGHGGPGGYGVLGLCPERRNPFGHGVTLRR